MAVARRLETVERGTRITIQVDGEPVSAFAGESIAAALMASGRRAFRTNVSGAPRGLFCGMGICFDCLVTVDGVPNVRACMTEARDGNKIELRETL
ncbi:MAG: (2Fe-2S)-binding protein [Chloroflexi bacterium]|nr:(2Fe-2S)-binding protein [Chloroflexota bacterium]